MKTKLTILTAILFLGLEVLAQAPDGVNYQAVVRNVLGLPLNNQTVDVRFTIHTGSPTGPTIFTETHIGTTTTQFGLINLELGSVNNGVFSGINWGLNGPHYLQIEVDAGTGFDNLGASQLLSVPFALYSRSSASGPQGFNSLIDTVSATVADCPTGGYEVLMGLDANANTVLDAGEVTSSFFVCNGSAASVGDNWGIDTVNTSGANITGSGTVSNPLIVTETDGSITNEIQTISINVAQDTIFLSNGGGFIQVPTISGDNWGTDVVNTVGGNISGDGTSGNPLSVIDNDSSSTNEIQDLTINGNYISVTGGLGDSISATQPNVGEFLYWNGINWVSQGIAGNTDNQNLLNGGKVGNAQTVNIQSGTGVTFSVADEDSLSTNEIQQLTFVDPFLSLSLGGGTVNIPDTDPSNELITNFSLNGTSDSLVIVESGVGHAFPLSDLSDGDWTKGIGTDIFNNTDSIGVGTNNPRSLFQLGDYMHIFPLNMGVNEDYSVLTYNSYWDGLTVRNTTGGTSGISILGHDNGSPVYSVMLYPSQPAGTDMMGVNPAPKMTLKDKGLAINADNPGAALHVSSIDSAAILMELPDDGSQATMFYQSPSGDLLGLRVAPSMFGNSYTLTYPSALPTVTGAPLVSDLAGNMSWGSIAAPLWKTNGTDVTNANSGNVGIGMLSPTALFDIQDSTASGAATLFNVGYNLGGSILNVTNDQSVNVFGNVGIGIASPSFQFQINKNQSGSTPMAAIVNTNATGDAPMLFSSNGSNFMIGADGNTFKIASSATNLALTTRMTIGSTGNVGFGTAAPVAVVHANAVGTATAIKALSNNGTALDVTSLSGGAAAIFWNGFVGIGLTPTARFHSSGTLRLENLGGAAPANGSVLTSIDASGNTQWQTPAAAKWNTSGLDISNANLGGVGIGVTTNFNPGSYTLLNNAGASKVLTVTSDPDGLVGNAVSSLVLEGSATSIGLETGVIDFVNTNTAGTRYNYARIAATREHATNYALGGLRFYTRTGTSLNEQMMINENGLIGIGTSTPSNHLTIYDANSHYLQLIDDITGLGSGDGIRLGMNGAGTGYLIFGETTGYFHIGTSTDNNLIKINPATDFVGIGTGNTAPAQKLDVSGNVRADNFLYTSPKTRYLTIGEGDFRIAKSADGDIYSSFGAGGVGIVNSTAANALVAPAYLPHGAVITGITVYYMDNSASDMNVTLYSRTLTGSASSLATNTTVGFTTAVQNMPLTTGATINNQGNSYYFRVYSTGWATTGTVDMSIKTIQITYTISETD